MAPLISFGWVILGIVIILLKFGEEKLGGSIKDTAKLFLYPILFFMLIAACASTNNPSITLLIIAPGLLLGKGVATAEESVSKGVAFGLTFSIVAAFWFNLCIDVIWEITWKSEFLSIAVALFGLFLAFYVAFCIIRLMDKPARPQKPDYINWEEVQRDDEDHDKYNYTQNN